MDEPSPTYPCPACQTAVDAPADPTVNLLECPNCGNQFFIKRAAAPRRFGDAGEFADRVHDLAKGRRSLIRFRSYFIIGGLGCFILLGQVIFSLIRYHWTATGRNVLGMLAIVFVVGLVFFTRRAMAVTVLLNRPLLGKPNKPPSFDKLGQ